MTINQLMCLQKIVRERLGDLKNLRTQVAVKERYYGSTEKTVEPQYDMKTVDKKIIELQNFIYQSDSLIKASNAITEVKISINEGDLLSSLQ